MPLLDLNWLVSTNRRPRSPSIAANVATNEEYVTTSPTGAKSRTLISPPTPTTTTTVTTVKANTNGTAVANTSATVSAQTILSRSASTDSLKKRKNTFVLHFGSLRFGKNVFTSEPEEQERDPGDAAHQRHDSKFADDKSTHSADSTVQLQSVGDEEQDNEVDERDETEKDNEAEQDNEAERVSEDSEAVPDNEVEQINEAERIYEDNEAERINEDNEAEQDNEVEQNNEAERIYEDSEAERINEENEAEQDNEIEQNNEAERINEEQDDETEQDNEAELRSEVEQDKAEDNVLAQAIRAGQPDCELDDKATQIAHPDYELAHPGYELAQPRYELTQPGYELAQPRYELAQPGYELAQPGYELAQPGDELTLPSQQEGELTQQEGELTQQPQPDCELAQPDGDIEPAKPTELTPPCNEPAQSNQSQSNDSPHDVASQTDSELNKVPLSQPNGEPTHPAQPDITSHSERKQIHSEFEQLYRRITSQLDSQAMFQINHHQQQRMPRVKVQWQDTRLVIPVPVQKGSKQPVTVARLLKEIDARFRKHAKGLDDDNYFVELRTIDGFVLDKSDRAADVIGDGDVLCAIDYSNWFKNFKAENSLTEWLSVRRIDYVDNNHKWVRVGQTTRANQIYFDFGTGVYGAEESKRFRVIDEEEIESLPKPSRKFIEGVKGGQDPDRWFADAYIVTDETGTRHVEITVKSMSDHRPQIETLCFARNVDGKYQMKSKKVIQAVFVPSVPKAYTVSTIMTEGPTLKEDDYPTPLDPSKVVVQSTGESPFMLQQTGYPLAEQHWDYSGAWQLVTCAFRITNTASKTLSVIGISAEVQDKKGEWRSALAYSGGKESAIYYNIRNEHDAILRYDAHSVNKLSLRVKYGLDYTNYKSYSGRARRLHPSLPNPCNIRFTLRDQNDTRTSIVLQAFGTGGFMTRRAYEERLHMKLYHWVQCDDTNSEERMYVPIEYKQGWASHSVLEINLLVASRKHQIEAEVLRRWTWLANREGVSELEIKDWNWEGSDGAFGIKFHALFDCDEKQVYGMKITLHTTTSKVVDSFLFPKDLIMQ